jgi:hypothetical protein
MPRFDHSVKTEKERMRIIRKLIRTRGGSYQLFIPKRWVEDMERLRGLKMVKMRLTTNSGIDLDPVFEDGNGMPKGLKRKYAPTLDKERARLLSEMKVGP